MNNEDIRVEKNNMKVFYLAQENFGCVVYADNENNAFEKMKCQRKELLETLGLPLDITRWGIEKFTPDLYDGVLCFIKTKRKFLEYYIYRKKQEVQQKKGTIL